LRPLPLRSQRYFLPELLGYEGLEHELEISNLLLSEGELAVEPSEQPSTKTRGGAVFVDDELSEANIATAEMFDVFVKNEKVKHFGKEFIVRTRLEPTGNVALTSRGRD
jgi:hypothetical protein